LNRQWQGDCSLHKQPIEIAMKYIMMAIAAGAFIACNEGPNNDRMETAPRNDHPGQERMYDTPEMSGEYDEMRRPVDEVHPPGDVIPENHKIVGDSVIVPIDAHHQQGTRMQQDHGMQHDARVGTQPVMPQGDSPHHSSGNVGTVEGTVPETHDVHDDGTIAPATGTTPQHNVGTGEPALGQPSTDTVHDDHGQASDTTIVPITEDGIHDIPGPDDQQQGNTQGAQMDDHDRPLTHP
jgi:hypothetical protein